MKPAGEGLAVCPSTAPVQAGQDTPGRWQLMTTHRTDPLMEPRSSSQNLAQTALSSPPTRLSQSALRCTALCLDTRPPWCSVPAPGPHPEDQGLHHVGVATSCQSHHLRFFRWAVHLFTKDGAARLPGFQLCGLGQLSYPLCALLATSASGSGGSCPIVL